MELPNVVRRSSLLLVILWTAVLFAFYYVWMFGCILNLYKGFYKQSSFTKSKDGLLVEVEIPKYYFKAGPATIYVHVENKSGNVYENLKVYLVIGQLTPDTLLLPNIFNDDTYSLGTEIPLLAPYSTAIGRISLVTQSRVNITNVFLVQGTKEPEIVAENSHIRFDESPGKAMQLQILEHILLPPWSNVYLSALALISVFMANRYRPNKDSEEPVFQPPQRFDDPEYPVSRYTRPNSFNAIAHNLLF